MDKNNKPNRKPFMTALIPLIPLILFVLLSYGLLLNRLGFYWDDWPYVWTRLELGYHGLLRHFSFSRPVAGQIHNLAILITNGSPLLAQVWGLCMQVFGSFCAGLLVREIWTKKTFAAALTALLFLAYPGFTMRPIAINFSFSYFLMGMLFISFILSARAARGARHKGLLITAACLISLLNLFASEYFFLLELLRPCFLAAALSDDAAPSPKERLFRTLKQSLPYASVFAAGIIYRMFFNRTQTLHYEFKLLTDFKAAPLPTVWNYLLQMGKDCLRVIFEAWGTVFEFPNITEFGSRSTLIYALIGTVATVITRSDRELSIRSLIIRKAMSLLLIEGAIILIALKADTIPTEKSWVLPGLALGILAVFVLSHLILYLIDRKEAEKLNADLARYQEKQITQSEDKDEI